MHNDTDVYDIARIRGLLRAAFTPKELRRFCQDRPTFQPIVSRFGPAHGLDDMVDDVIDFCTTRRQFGKLLEEVRQVNQPQYDRFAPYRRGANDAASPGRRPKYLPTVAEQIAEDLTATESRKLKKKGLSPHWMVVLAAAIGGMCVVVAAIIVSLQPFIENKYLSAGTPAPSLTPTRISTRAATRSMPPTLGPTITSASRMIPTPTPSGTLTRTNTPTLALTADTTPALRPETPTPKPPQTGVPPGYSVVDDFGGEGPIGVRWEYGGDLETCGFERGGGLLHIDCQGKAGDGVEWGYWTLDESYQVVRGVAMAAQVLQETSSSSHFVLTVRFTGPDGTEVIRLYIWVLKKTSVYVREAYQIEPYRDRNLVQVGTPPGTMHVFQIEHDSGALAFYIDGRPIELGLEPDLPAGAKWELWLFEGGLFEDEGEDGALSVQIDWVAVKK